MEELLQLEGTVLETSTEPKPNHSCGLYHTPLVLGCWSQRSAGTGNLQC